MADEPRRDTRTRADYERLEVTRPERTGQPAQRIGPGEGPPMRFDPSGAQRPMKEHVPWAQRAAEFAQWMGMALPGRGGIIYRWDPHFAKEAKAQGDYLKRMHIRSETTSDVAQRLLSEQQDPFMLPSRYEPGTRQARKAAQEAGDYVEFDFTKAKPIFEKGRSYKRKQYEGREGPIMESADPTTIHLTDPQTGKKHFIGVAEELRGQPGEYHATDVQRSPNVMMSPKEFAHLRDAYLRHKGLHSASQLTGGPDPHDIWSRLIYWGGGPHR